LSVSQVSAERLAGGTLQIPNCSAAIRDSTGG